MLELSDYHNLRGEVTMNRVEKEQFLYINRIIFEGNELLLDNDIEGAEERYQKLMDSYKLLPEDLKNRTYPYATQLRERILNQKKGAINNQANRYFRLFDGRVIKDLYHLVYVLDTITELQWQFHVNAVRNDLVDWIRYKLRDNELANLIEGLTDKEELKRVILRHLLLQDFKLE